MTEEQSTAFVNSQVACALIEMEGMKAENMQRQAQGHDMVYLEADFNSIQDRYEIGYNSVIGRLQR